MAIALAGVTRRFGAETAVDGVTLDVAEGEFFAVLGPSGCGKSTLLRLIAGLERLDAGRIALSGRAVAGPGLHRAPEDRGVGVVFQSYALWPHMSVAENVAFPVEAAGRARADARAEAAACLRTVALEPYAARRPAELSGGQRQRVALARCLAQRAGTILMDEPLANLDPHLRGAMEEELAAFHAASGATTLYITHDQREAMALADRLAVMWAGRLLQVSTPEAVYRRPASARVAGFVGRGAVPEAEVTAVEGTRAQVRLGPATLTADCAEGTPTGPARLLLRPEDLAPDPDGALAARLATVRYRGGLWEAEGRAEGLDAPLALALPWRAQPGETLRLALRSGWVLPGTD